jgi:hypothetical protein
VERVRTTKGEKEHRPASGSERHPRPYAFYQVRYSHYMYFLDLEQPLLTCPEYRGTMTARGDIWQRDDSRPPAGPPPPGITSDFLNPPSTAHKIIVVSVAFSVLSSLFIALRLYTILSITHQRGTDDCECWLARFSSSLLMLLDLLVISWVPSSRPAFSGPDSDGYLGARSRVLGVALRR